MKKLLKSVAVISAIATAIAGVAYFAKKKSLEDTFEDDFDDDFDDEKVHKENSNVSDRSYVSINIDTENITTEPSEASIVKTETTSNDSHKQ